MAPHLGVFGQHKLNSSGYLERKRRYEVEWGVEKWRMERGKDKYIVRISQRINKNITFIKDYLLDGSLNYKNEVSLILSK